MGSACRPDGGLAASTNTPGETVNVRHLLACEAGGCKLSIYLGQECQRGVQWSHSPPRQARECICCAEWACFCFHNSWRDPSSIRRIFRTRTKVARQKGINDREAILTSGKLQRINQPCLADSLAHVLLYCAQLRVMCRLKGTTALDRGPAVTNMMQAYCYAASVLCYSLMTLGAMIECRFPRTLFFVKGNVLTPGSSDTLPSAPICSVMSTL